MNKTFKSTGSSPNGRLLILNQTISPSRDSVATSSLVNNNNHNNFQTVLSRNNNNNNPHQSTLSHRSSSK